MSRCLARARQEARKLVAEIRQGKHPFAAPHTDYAAGYAVLDAAIEMHLDKRCACKPEDETPPEQRQ